MRSKAVADMLHNRAVEHIDDVLSRDCDCTPCQAIKQLVKQRDENTAELLALRKVADAAADLCMIDSRAGAVTGLADALKAAGRGNGGS